MSVRYPCNGEVGDQSSLTMFEWRGALNALTLTICKEIKLARQVAAVKNLLMLREKYRRLQDYMATRPRLRRFAKVLPFFAIGPISGPLVAGIVFNLKDGRPVRAGLYAVALVQYVVLLPVLVAKLGLDLI